MQSSDKQTQPNPPIADAAHLAGALFLWGSLLLVGDAGLELFEGLTPHAVLHLVAGVMFLVGSFLFMRSGPSQ
jgi:hypothetical protein